MKTNKTVESRSSLADLMSYICLLILVLLPLHAVMVTWLGGVFNQPELFKIWKELIIVFLIPGCVILLLRHKRIRKDFFRSTLVVAILSYLIITLLRAWYGHVTGNVNLDALAYGLLANMRYLGFFLVTYIVAQLSSILLDRWVQIVVGPATVVIMFGILQQFLLAPDFLRHLNYGPDTIPAFQVIDSKADLVRVQSTLKGPNPLGAYLVLILTTFVGLFIKLKSRRFIFAFLGVASLIVLFFTYSRSAFIGVSISLVVWVMLGITSKRKLALSVIAISLFSIFMATGVYIFRNNELVQNTIFHTDENSAAHSSTNEVRGSALQNGLKDIKADPQGLGVGTAGPASWHNNQPARIAENYFIQIGQEVGILGLFLFVIINVLAAAGLYFKRRELLPRVLFASLVGISFINLVSHAWMDDTLSLMWWGLAGIALAPAIINRKHEKQTKSEKITN